VLFGSVKIAYIANSKKKYEKAKATQNILDNPRFRIIVYLHPISQL